MEKLLITIHNSETGEIETREMNQNELDELANRTKSYAAEQELLVIKSQQKAALLKKLGITAEEAALLLG